MPTQQTLPIKLYQALIERSSDGFVVFSDGRCALLNSPAEAWLGASTLGVGRTLFELCSAIQLPDRTVSSWEALIEALPEDQQVKAWFLPVEGTTEASAVTLQRATIDGQSWISLHLSQVEELTEALSSLESLNIELEQASRAKDDFLASMSHELRTPLNSILGLSEALLESIYGKLNVEQAQSVRQISKSGEHLLVLISDILDISKIRAGGMKLSLSEIDVESICSEVIQQFKPEMKRKQLSFSLDIEGVYVLTADQRWFKQLLMNLMSNAVKFTPSSKRIGLKVKGDSAQGLLRITVWDEGIGVKPQDQERLFQPFVQIDSSLSRAYEGTGLGLSIVSSIMELHGGAVSIDSTLNQGSSFHLDFPWTAGLTLPEPGKSSEAPSLETVLVVEDSVIDAEKLKRYLAELGTDIIWDSTGALTINQAEHAKPELVMLDLHLPEASGLELLMALKAHPTLSSIPVVICSVLEPSESSVPQELISGYLVKPFSRDSLLQVLQSLPGDHSSSNQDSTPPHKAIIAQPHERISDKKTILVVDDNLSNIQLVQDYLKRKGFDLLTAEDGLQAVHISRTFYPDLILMDIQMPRMDGIEATQLLRSDEQTRDIPIFALTALAMPGDKERCLDAGMDDYFTKPVSLRELTKRIQAKLA